MVSKLLALFAFAAVALVLSLASGNSFLAYRSVSRDKQPTGYWTAVGILALLTLFTGAFAAWGLLGHPLP